MSRMLKKGYKFITKKETEIQSLKDNNNHLKGEIEILKRDKEYIEKRIFVMEQQKDSLDKEVKKQDEILEKINDKYEEIDRITNFNDKQLHEFFTNYNRRYNTR
jgi:chromosome segregation ATPase